MIFPCHNATKRPLTEHGLHDATRDPATIAAWFEKWPGAMIGVKCGRESGLLVVDCDVDTAKNIDAVATFAEMFPSLPETTTVRTPRTGRHYYFSYPCAGADIRNSAGKIAPGIDIRAEGGYVVAAGSQRSDGVFYEALVDTEPAPAPQALIERLAAEKPKAEAPPPPSAKAEAPPPASRDDAERAMLARAVARGRRGERRSGNGHDNAYGRAALEAECAKVASAVPGTRNHTLNAAAFSLGQLIAGGVLGEAETRLALRDAADACGLIRDDGAPSVVATVNSGLAAGAKQPRTPPAKDEAERTIKEALQPSAKDEVGRQPISTDEIMRTTFKPISYVAPGVIIEGVTLLAAKPKAGKSWLVLHAAYAVATGGFTLGEIHCAEGDVLYCALEDNLRRIKSRMIKMFGPDVEGSPRLQVLCEMEKLAQGGIDRLKRWIASAANPRMIIIDTLSMVRVSKSRDDTAFQADYDAVKDLRALANEYGIAIILVHHLRKADSEDPFDTVNATLGLTAAVDSVLIIKRDTHGNCTLHGRGRDLVEIEKALVFNKDNCTWTLLGDAFEMKESADRNAIIAALAEGQTEMSLQDIAAATGINGTKLRVRLHRMVNRREINRTTRGRYTRAETTPSNDHM